MLQAWEEWLEICLAEKELGMLVDRWLNQCVQAKKLPSYMRYTKVSRTREVIVSLYSAMVRLQLKHCGPDFSLTLQDRH